MRLSIVWIKAMAFGFGIFGCAAAKAQQPDTLANFLPKLGWDIAKSGTLIVVDPEHTKIKTQASTLQAFDRKLVVLGKLSAIVPTEMILIDDSYKEPNLYDGLPIEAKVLYLLSTLSASQLELANTNGIGKRDLQGEQIKVLKSIVPTQIGWKTILLTGHSLAGDAVDQGVVPPDQMDQVKLKIQSGLTFHLGFQDKPNSYSPIPGTEMYGKAGDKVTIRDRTVQQASFGIDPRVRLPNKLKPSDLNYAAVALGKTIQAAAHITVGQLLNQIGTATGVEIRADLRVGNLPMEILGTSATARDLLQAIALCVTGTYRKVGSAYVLTSDLVGLGVRKLKFAAWQQNVNREVWTREGNWRQAIVKSGALSKIGFDPKDPLAPDDRARNSLDQVNDKLQDDKVPAADLTSEIRDYLSRYVGERPGQGYLLDKVGIHSQIQFSFVLPNGTALHPEFSSLGEHSWFSSSTLPQKEDPILPEALTPNPAVKHKLLVHAETDAEAVAAANLARTHGISELWLDTHHKSALLAAQNHGVRVILVIRPWEAFEGDPSQKLDRNMLGDSGLQLAVRRGAEYDWQQYQKYSDLAGRGPALLYNLVDPSDNELGQRWDKLAMLAHTPALDGVAVLDLEPQGYEAKDNHSNYGVYSPWLSVLNEFGYTDAMRLAFLRDHGMDPIDIAAPNTFLDFDVQQPFFLDDRLGQYNNGTGHVNPAMGSMPDDWFQYRSTLNQKATESLFSRFSDLSVPIYVMPMLNAVHMPPDMNTKVVLWTPGNKLPKYDPADFGVFSLPGLVLVYTLNEESSAVATRDLGWALKGKGAPVAVDVSSVKNDRLPQLLDRWFPKLPDK